MLIHDQEGKTWRMNQQLQPFNVSQWTPRKVNTCHLSVHRLQAFQPLPMVNPEETESAGLQAPDGWGTYQGNNFNEPWLLHLPIHRIYVFPGGSAGKESGCNAADLGSIPGLGRSPGEGNSYPLQYSGLENSMDCIVHGVTKSRTQLSNFHFIHRKGLNFLIWGAVSCIWSSAFLSLPVWNKHFPKKLKNERQISTSETLAMRADTPWKIHLTKQKYRHPLFPQDCGRDFDSGELLHRKSRIPTFWKRFLWLAFHCFCYYNHTEWPASENPAPLSDC